jgi:hypothetical protein
MQNQSLIHDVSYVTAREIMKMLAVQEEYYELLRQHIYHIIRAGIECYEIKAERRQSRLEGK